MTWFRRAPWWLLALIVGASGVTIAAASTLALTSKNLTVFKTCVLTGNPNTSTAVIDTAVKQDAATTNFGTATTIDVQSKFNKNHRVYVKFDLTKCSPAIGASAAVKIATLRLYMSGVPNACETEDLFKVTATWTEAGITWNNQPFGTAVNNPASGSASATATVGASPCGYTAAGYVTWTVTTDTQAFVAGSSTNFGWMVRDDVEDFANTAATYSTKDLNTLAQAPQLVVNYT